jgi:cytochrome P450
LNVINERKENNKIGKAIYNDFLQTLLAIDEYKNNDSLMVEECATLFLAGFVTVSTST